MTSALPALVFVSLEDWDDIWRRNQFLCSHLTRHLPGLKILFLEKPRNLSGVFRTRDVRGVLQVEGRVAPEHPGIRLTRAWKLMPNGWAAGRLCNEALLRHHLRRLCHATGVSRPLLWINDHSAAHLVGHLNEAAVIYDVTDDWTSFPEPEPLHRRTVAQDAALCRQADAVIVRSTQLFNLKQGHCRSLHLIPNGVDLPHYERVSDTRCPRPVDALWSSPAVGYTGTIHPARVDLDLVNFVAASRPDVSVVMMGPLHLTETELQRLAAHPNMFVTGPRPYRCIPDYMRTLDVCITPHVVTPFTESLNPIKLWEYLAAGLPIVSTDVAGFRDYPELIRVARDPREFVEQIQQALQEGTAHQAERRALAARNSWTQRVDEVVKIVQQAIGGEL